VKRAPATSDRAFVLRVSPYGDADAIVNVLTEKSGVVGAIAKRARASSTRKNWVLEPFHTLSIELSATSGELSILRSSTIEKARTALLDDATRLDAAGLATRWTRTLSPTRVPEPEVFAAMESLLDALAAGVDATAALSAYGLLLLDALGYGLELAACARCARARPSGRAAYVSGPSGGVLCESCRRGAAIDAPIVAGELLDRIASDPWTVLEAGAEDRDTLARIVRGAIEMRARAVGAKVP
jgi:DNA repair protein RecO (recombination protein O)